MAVVALAAAGAAAWWHLRGDAPAPAPTASVEGRVALRALDGGVLVPEHVAVQVYTREMMEDHLRAWLKRFEQSAAANEMSIESARQVWRERNAARLEAARVVQVAEKSNAADLGLCRARLRQAEESAQESFARLEQLSADGERTADPASILGSLPPSRMLVHADPEGNFALELQPGDRLVLVLAAGEDKDRAVWLHSLEVPSGEGEPLEFSAGSLLTIHHLRALLSSK
ncbi:MAG: hypothetical protein IAE97_03955 [Chthoniobacterales bacterium]|nr:hypothetical protein [Chthoniobacterales bacterium]